MRKYILASQQTEIEQLMDSELFSRTPGFSSFQEEEWQSHCEEPCEFHGQARVADFLEMTEEARKRLISNSSLDESEFQYLTQGEDTEELHYYFKFVCRRCGIILAIEDLD